LSPGPIARRPGALASMESRCVLVESLGHCGACHTPRNALGAERTAAALHLAGGDVDSWHAPALTALSRAPIAWTEAELFTYLRTGFSQFHGTAAGPMAQVVQQLAAVPDADIRAMATYLASFAPAPSADPAAQAAALKQAAEASLRPLDTLGGKLYDGACASCHSESGPKLFGVRPALALNTNVRAATPDNLIRVILDGIPDPAAADLGDMPAFRDSFSDEQVAALVNYMRGKFAPNAPAWSGVEHDVARLRAHQTTH
ncbi:cytochrome c, partial [Rhodopseudomonas sp. B29]|uniref:c-type cytochrome n=1 Tax=Rhodopseudomonas sp. B29 TaxID=95607 RepID=UPI0027D7DBE7